MEETGNMATQGNENWPFVVNLGNSIIGVAILAMPFCFKQCGILLGMMVLLFCTWLTLASSRLLVKAGIVSHHRSYEFLAYHTYGAPGKFLVEIGMIGMQLGTLVAQIVVIGDLGPPIVSHLLGFENNSNTRLYLIVVLCLFVGLPLGLMKDLRNVSRASTICIMFYAVFTVYVLWMSRTNLLSAEWYSHVNFWRPQGLFQCLPILSFSFGCQTQLFIVYDALPEPSLHAIKSIIYSAVNLCAVAYLLVGFFGYVTFYHLDIPGDVITVFPGTLGTHLIKLGFVMSIAITFPVIIFPCRASLYTLLFQKDFEPRLNAHADDVTTVTSKSKLTDDMASTYIPEFLFKGITVSIVLGSMITGILIPNVEFILGLNGAITGTLICYIFPALFFLRVMSSKAEGKTIAQVVLLFGVSILLISTFTTLNAQDKSHAHQKLEDLNKGVDLGKAVEAPHPIDVDSKLANALEPPLKLVKEGDGDRKNKNIERRVEPPNPNDPVQEVKKVEPAEKEGAVEKAERDGVGVLDGDKGQTAAGGGREERGEGQHQRQEQLLEALEVQRQEQAKLLQEQKVLLQEMKNHKEQEHQDQEQPAVQKNEVKEEQAQQKNVAQDAKQQKAVQQNGALQQKQRQPADQQGKQVPVNNQLVMDSVNNQPQQPKQNPVNNQPQQPMQNPVNIQPQQPMQNPVNNQPQQLVQNPVNNQPQQPMQNPVNNQPQQPMQNPVNNQPQQPMQNPVNNQPQQPMQNPVNNQPQQPIQNPVNNQPQQPMQNPVNNQPQQPIQNPVNNQPQQPMQNPVNNQPQQPMQNPVNNQPQQPMQNPFINQPHVQVPDAVSGQPQLMPIQQNQAASNQVGVKLLDSVVKNRAADMSNHDLSLQGLAGQKAVAPQSAGIVDHKDNKAGAGQGEGRELLRRRRQAVTHHSLSKQPNTSHTAANQMAKNSKERMNAQLHHSQANVTDQKGVTLKSILKMNQKKQASELVEKRSEDKHGVLNDGKTDIHKEEMRRLKSVSDADEDVH